MSRAIDATPLTQKFVDNVFASYGASASGGAAVLVAQDGKVLVSRAYGITVQGRFTPETGAPHFALAGLSAALNAALAPDSTGRLSAASVRRVTATGGTQRLAYDSTTKLWTGNVDDLYRFDQARTAQNAEPKGFGVETQRGDVMQVVYGGGEGRRSAWVRYPGRKTTIIILTNDDRFDAKSAATRIADRLLAR
jgi:CubicO group peptidase (beta-lactamase class C family)